MNASSRADLLRQQLRRKTGWVVAVAVAIAGLDLLLLPVPPGSDWRTLVVVVAAIVEAVLVTSIGSWLLRRPVLQELETLERQATATESERAYAERLASAGRVAAGLVHEVGNPLCAITNYAHTLEDKVAPELRATLTSLQREVSRIERIMDGFMDHTRPREPGSLGADVNHSLRETLGFLGDQGVLRRIAVETHLDGTHLPVPGMPLELEQTFANLVLNAADAMPGGGRLAIWTRRLPRLALIDGSLRRAGDDGAAMPPRHRDGRLDRWVAACAAPEVVKIVFADSGHGVKRGEEDRIFEPFVTTKAPDRGSGLGLATVRRLVEAMRGLVWVQTSREGGAAFHLVLPIHDRTSA
jgi:signal transduction histidine kinase